MIEDVVKELGHLSLGTRFKRIGETLQAQTQAVLAAHGFEQPAAWFPMLAALDRLGPPDAARLLGTLAERVRSLRARYPDARLVLLAGGMTAWKDEPAIPRALQQALTTLRDEGDDRVWTYTFQAFAYAHPRIDVHTQMADELTRFLQTEVLQ